MTPRRIVGYVRRAPGTFVYLTLLSATTWVLSNSDAKESARILLARSTNLAHLSRDPLHVLLASAFWLPSPGELPMWAALFVLVLARVEHRVGTRRTFAVFAIGHVGATLLVAAGLWVTLLAHAVDSSVVDAQDVGVSYGFFAVAGAATCLVARPLRIPWLGGLLLYAAGDMLTTSITFTDFGHLFSVLLGVACMGFVRRAAFAGAQISPRSMISAPLPGLPRQRPEGSPWISSASPSSGNGKRSRNDPGETSQPGAVSLGTPPAGQSGGRSRPS
jgi:hypothetical protein